MGGEKIMKKGFKTKFCFKCYTLLLIALNKNFKKKWNYISHPIFYNCERITLFYSSHFFLNIFDFSKNSTNKIFSLNGLPLFIILEKNDSCWHFRKITILTNTIFIEILQNVFSWGVEGNTCKASSLIC